MDIYLTPTPQGLVPLYDSDYQLFLKLKHGYPYRCKLTQPRNYKFHKKFFALVRITFDNLPAPLANLWDIHTPEEIVRKFKRDLGLYTARTNPYGEREIEYHSISFAAMDQHDFEQFYAQAVSLVLGKYLKGLNRQDLEEALHEFM